MEPFIYDKEQVTTNNVVEISEYLKNESSQVSITPDYESEELDVYLESDCGNFLAKYYNHMDAVGFFRKKHFDTVVQYSLKHLKSSSELEDANFTITKENKINILDTQLPKGDLLVFLDNGDVVTLNKSFIDYVYEDLDSAYPLVNRLVYTGLSKGLKENKEIDFVIDTVQKLSQIHM